jgi:desulfoferrodoxin (superoxide reductase-like protein)
MKVNSKIYKGIEYIQLSDLPKEQQALIIQHLDEDFFIKILVENSVISHCIQYKDYVMWFETVYGDEGAVESAEAVNSPVLVGKA